MACAEVVVGVLIVVVDLHEGSLNYVGSTGILLSQSPSS